MLFKTWLSFLLLASSEPVSALWPAPHSKEIVKGGVSRSLGSIFRRNLIPWKLVPKNKIDEFEPPLGGKSTSVTSLVITQTSQDQPKTFKALAGEVDESYSLTIDKEGRAKLSAKSSIGILRGLETFSQLFYQHSTGTCWYTPYAPVSIDDAPLYPHRGILFDTARQWYPVVNLLRTIDAMAWNKMNRLHVHVTDSQSWPLDLPSMPEVAREGAHRRDLIYTADDIRRVQEYGVHRGVQVYFEIDMPGHIGSLYHSHPELIVAYNEQPYYHYCAQPPCGAFKLNDSRVDAFLEKLFDDVLPRVHPYAAYFHTGGDELNANDSMLDENIRSNKSEVLQPLLQKFIDKQHERVRSHDLTPMVWEEIPLDWNVTLGKDVPVQSWLGNAQKLAAAGHQVIDSNYNFWYLDCGRGQWINMENGAAYRQFYPFNDWCGPTKSWQLVYSYDPRAGLSEEAAKLVLGGEVAIWSETIDEQTIDSIIWPRANAAGEVLWSGRIDPATGQNRSQLEAIPRLSEMRERLVARGVRPAALTQLWCTQANPLECSYPL
ncbi:beta-hexosaminidase subunit beta [Pyricularia oryzae]|nr:beta-hexosaminidase subunit beta [Pyricularia oryzae]